MRVVLLTQDDPFFLGKNIDFLLGNLPRGAQVVGCVLFQVSPFGKRQSFLEKLWSTFRIFGTEFFLRYAILFLKARVSERDSVNGALQKHGVPLINVEGTINSPEAVATIASYKPDLLVSVAGNQIFHRPLLDLAPKGCINLHTALLPRYRGLMPTFWVLKNGESETGVSVFFVDEGIDSGPILVQKRVEIGGRTQLELIEHTKQIGMQSIIEAMELIMRGRYTLIANDPAKASYYSFPTRADVREFLARGKRFF